MRRGIAIVLLSAGVVLGFGSGFAHLFGYGPCGHGRYAHGAWGDHHAFEERAADACVRAAERVLAERRSPAPPAPPAPSAP